MYETRFGLLHRPFPATPDTACYYPSTSHEQALAQLGRPPNTFNPAQLQDLLKIKQSLGIPDPRFGLKECELCDNAEWRPGVTCAVNSEANENSSGGTTPDPEAEALVQAITEQIMSRVK